MAIADGFHTEAQQTAHDIAGLEDAAVSQARAWVDTAAGVKPDAAAIRLAGLLRDPQGLAFTVGFVDGVVRPEGTRVAAHNLRALSREVPAFLSWPLKIGVRVGGALAPLLPWAVVPVARRVLRTLLRHLVIDARPSRLGKAIQHLTAGTDGSVRLNINLLGEAVLGSSEAQRRMAGTLALIERDDVDYVSIKVSATVAPHTPWAFHQAVDDAVEVLRPLYRAAARDPQAPTFINLDMEEYHDLELTLAVFMTLLDDPELRDYRGGIVLQAYLPDALAAMMRVQEWAARRVADGGAPVKVRVVKGANLPMERVDADVHGWPLATWASKAQTDANYKAILGYSLRPERVAHVAVGVAGHNLFDIALAWELAGQRGVREAVDVEMLLGMAPQQVQAVRQSVGQVLLYTPIVRPSEFDAAIAYLIRRLEEGASQENFMSAAFDLDDEDLFARERERFRDSIALMPSEVPAANRVQNRTAEKPAAVSGTFANTPDTDPAVHANIGWADAIRARIPDSSLGTELAAASTVGSRDELDALMASARDAGREWAGRPAAERAEVLRRAGATLAGRRGDLIEVMGAECGKVIDQADPEVSEAIDFALYYADSAERLEHVDGARFEPVGVTVVTPPWNFPVAIPAGSVLAALAAGSAVIFKPAEQAHRCSTVVAEALWEAGVPRDVLQYVRVDEGALGRDLITHDLTDQVILTGGYETAQLFRSFDPSLRLFAETSGKNAIIVTPSADLDLAAKDVVASAFGHAGQKCSAASLVVLVGSVAQSERFRRQLADAAASMRVGLPEHAASQIGPVIEPPQGKLARALTSVEEGQSWLLEPQCLSEDGMLWSPGIREGVRDGDEFHLTEYFGPILGIMEADTVKEAVTLVNRVDYGLTSGLHSLDNEEIARWMEHAESGNLYVNRSITGAIVQRQPFGGWKRSTVGTGTKAGGPHYVAGLGRWVDATPQASAEPTDDLSARVLRAADDADVDSDSRAWLAAALATDEREWEHRFATVTDPSGLEYEHNAWRYQAVPVTVRLGAEADPTAALRVLAAGLRTGCALTVSHAAPLAPSVERVLVAADVVRAHEDADAWAARANGLSQDGGRVRIVGEDTGATLAATAGSPAVAIHGAPPVSAGLVEMLPFLREQAVSVTAHRFGVRREYLIPPLAPARR